MRRASSVFMRYAMVGILMALANSVYAAGSFNVMFGNKSLKENDWKPVESQTEYGLGFEFQKPSWPLTLVMSYSKSTDSAVIPTFGGDIKMTGETSALNIGARKYLIKDHVRIFVEGGLASISATANIEFQGLFASVSDSAVGPWFGAGAAVMVSDVMSIGVLGRMSSASVVFADVEVDAGGTHFAAFAAYHFE